MQQTSRPLTQHRSSLSHSSASGLPGRQTHSRNSSSSLLSTSLNNTHRVTRRKSVTNVGANVTTLTAALREGDTTPALPIANSSRRHTMSKTAMARVSAVGSLPSPPATMSLGKHFGDAKRGLHGSAIDDDSQDISADEEGDSNAQKARIRRASDGQPLIKEGRKSNRVEVRCETCGKGYKHSSCLIKHRLVPLVPCGLWLRRTQVTIASCRWTRCANMRSRDGKKTFWLTPVQLGAHS